MTQDKQGAGRVAIWSGRRSSSSNGRKLADRGMTVVAVDRNEAGLETIPDGIARK